MLRVLTTLFDGRATPPFAPLIKVCPAPPSLYSSTQAFTLLISHLISYPLFLK